MDFTGKTVLITGSNRGIGKTAIEAFFKQGANVIACARKQNDEFESFLNTLKTEENNWIKPLYFDPKYVSINLGIINVLIITTISSIKEKIVFKIIFLVLILSTPYYNFAGYFFMKYFMNFSTLIYYIHCIFISSFSIIY